jgi:hypothetical protein
MRMDQWKAVNIWCGKARDPDNLGLANSHPDNEARVFDFVGMLGVPLVPCHEFPTGAPAAFFSVHALKDPGFAAQLRRFIGAGKPVLVTDGLAARLTNQVDLTVQNVQVLPVKVLIYTETPRWWSAQGGALKLPADYAEALRRARTK